MYVVVWSPGNDRWWALDEDGHLAYQLSEDRPHSIRRTEIAWYTSVDDIKINLVGDRHIVEVEV